VLNPQAIEKTTISSFEREENINIAIKQNP
jgi:hypothetical protein